MVALTKGGFGMRVRYGLLIDWDRIMTEQRLWESGSLGRAWLRIRQRGAGQ
jgi:hypothetical protein